MLTIVGVIGIVFLVFAIVACCMKKVCRKKRTSSVQKKDFSGEKVSNVGGGEFWKIRVFLFFGKFRIFQKFLYIFCTNFGAMPSGKKRDLYRSIFLYIGLFSRYCINLWYRSIFQKIFLENRILFLENRPIPFLLWGVYICNLVLKNLKKVLKRCIFPIFFANFQKPLPPQDKNLLPFYRKHPNSNLEI